MIATRTARSFGAVLQQVFSRSLIFDKVCRFIHPQLSEIYIHSGKNNI